MPPASMAAIPRRRARRIDDLHVLVGIEAVPPQHVADHRRVDVVWPEQVDRLAAPVGEAPGLRVGESG
jgi:hypothetical protein